MKCRHRVFDEKDDGVSRAIRLPSPSLSTPFERVSRLRQGNLVVVDQVVTGKHEQGGPATWSLNVDAADGGEIDVVAGIVDRIAAAVHHIVAAVAELDSQSARLAGCGHEIGYAVGRKTVQRP